MTAEQPDQTLVREVQRGNRQPLAELYERHHRRLYGYLLRATRDPAVADDLFQEVWMKVIGGVGGFDPTKGSFRAWAYRIASNAVIDRARYEGIRRGPELDAPAHDPQGPRRIDLIASADADPERRAHGSEAMQILDAALAEIPAKQKAAVLLRHQQGLSYRELAVSLDVPEGTAKALVHRGVHALREKMMELKR